MYVAQNTATIQPERLDEAIRIYRDEVLPRIKHLPGLQSIRVLVDRTTGTAIAIATYDTEAHARAAETTPQYQQVRGLLTPLLTSPPQRMFYEVALEA
jgi:quinol monooxygenase YgiN